MDDETALDPMPALTHIRGPGCLVPDPEEVLPQDLSDVPIAVSPLHQTLGQVRPLGSVFQILDGLVVGGDRHVVDSGHLDSMVDVVAGKCAREEGDSHLLYRCHVSCRFRVRPRQRHQITGRLRIRRTRRIGNPSWRCGVSGPVPDFVLRNEDSRIRNPEYLSCVTSRVCGRDQER